ncbi:alcohol dehydrogenase catalytic domain-containing protein [Microbacterium sp. CFH 31415]|uniref:alcohol dehydrogenase catalytic domain-containing protein n=1 Tax=Microbacterium sp. CFH 31415 TaxID=2921732 RepID=UPI0027E377E7|nr:alcohol dehydrogenase catalytic domain-containing protein [Microbacterium sp. CFH 31415]
MAVELCGLCGSDAHIWRGDDGYEWVAVGRVLGHEVVGTVSALGADVTGWCVGDRVVPIAQTGCGRCEACERDYANGCFEKLTLGLSRDGGAAPYVCVSATAVVAVAAHVPPLTAVLTEPASVAARAVSRGRIAASDTVAVSGPGAVGMLCAVMAHDLGAEVILVGTPADVEARGSLLQDLGIPIVASVPPGFTPDVWIEAAGAAALRSAAQALPVAARLVLVALYGSPPDAQLNVLVRREIEVITSYSSFRPDYDRAVDVLSRHPDLGERLVQIFSAGQLADAFEDIGRGAAVKVALAP